MSGRLPSSHPEVAPTRTALVRAVLGQAGVLCALVALCLVVRGRVDIAQLRAALAGAGPAVPVAWALLAGVLSAALVPGPILGTTSGALCGPFLGSGINLTAMLLSALIASSIGRFTVGRAPVPGLTTERRATLLSVRETHGTTAVLVQRLTPVLPDAPSSYAFGACGLRWKQILLGTLVGSSPWAVIYALIGAGVCDLATTGVLTICGLFLAANAAGFALARTLRRPPGERGSGLLPRPGRGRPVRPDAAADGAQRPADCSEQD
ncbi:MAG: hypothetical protein QG608_2161 [Actinomycetota bacterium]|nr:hypothetical protein [Actinomycetota bacterium]